MKKKIRTQKTILIGLIFIISGVIIYFYSPAIFNSFNRQMEFDLTSHDDPKEFEEEFLEAEEHEEGEEKKEQKNETIVPPIEISHLNTPEVVKAIYLSGWVAGTKNLRDRLVKIIEETELNSIVIDIKDSTGKISFNIDDPLIKELNSSENRISNIRELTNLLHGKGIYVIGRISVFQDAHLTGVKPEWAIKRLSDGGVWKDKKGLSFLDPMNQDVRDYTLAVALGAYEVGFDEINFDYIRYPSDGDIKDINYNLKEGETRADNIEDFFIFLSNNIKAKGDIPISADLFGLTTEAVDDMGIGQIWEKALPHFDFLCPMVYPSHYPATYNGYTNPALYPYEVVSRALLNAKIKTQKKEEDIHKIRPWLQDFNLGAVYTKELIRDQIKATYEQGLFSWMLWDPSNKYTPDALMPKIENNY